MKSRGPFLILVLLLGLCLLWVLLKKESTTENITQEEVSLASPGNKPALPSDTQVTAGTSLENDTALPQVGSDETVQPVPFETRLQEIAQCLNLKTVKPDEESTDMDFFSLNSALADKFGGYRDEDDLWASTEIKTSSGEHRRLLIDFREGQPALRYVAVQPDGSQKNIELSAEQANEPSEALIASLESDGQVTARARSRVVNYMNGQQLTLREVNGKIYSFQLTQGDKTYNCNRPTQNGNPQCSCSDRF